MANVLLGVTGSVAAVRTPQLYEQLKQAGHHVKVVATQASQYFFDPATLDPADPTRTARDPVVVVLDEDEWPGRAEGSRYAKSDPVLHIELRRWGEVLLIAPLDANTLAKFANGFVDNCLTSVWRAWDPTRPVVLAPAMNTLMWRHPVTERHMRQLAADAGAGPAPAGLDLDRLIGWIDQACPHLYVVAPQAKRLACGDLGMGGLAELDEIVQAVARSANVRRVPADQGANTFGG
jgi:phosphopantothenoylcysteine decarboxylase